MNPFFLVLRTWKFSKLCLKIAQRNTAQGLPIDHDAQEHMEWSTSTYRGWLYFQSLYLSVWCMASVYVHPGSQAHESWDSILYSLYIWVLTWCDAYINAHYKRKVERKKKSMKQVAGTKLRVLHLHSTSIYSIVASGLGSIVLQINYLKKSPNMKIIFIIWKWEW